MSTPMDHPDAVSQDAARRPPATILVVAVVFLALGCLDLYRAIAPLAGGAPAAEAARDSTTVGLIGVAALVGGGFLLLRRNWARWLLAGWMTFHVAISVGEPAKLAAHVVIFGIITFLLFRRGTAAYFTARMKPELRSDA